MHHPGPRRGGGAGRGAQPEREPDRTGRVHLRLTVAWPTLKEVRSFLRLQVDVDQDAVIQTALAAAVGAGVKRLGFVMTLDPDDVPAGVHADLSAGHYRAARRVPPGVPDARRPAVPAPGHYRRDARFGDMGVVRVGRFDADIEALYALDAPVVFG